MRRPVAGLAAVAIVGSLGLGGGGVLAASAALVPGMGGGAPGGGAPGGGGGGGGSSPVNAPAVPAPWESLEQAAAGTCPGLPWAVLAAIGRVESDSGRSRTPGVVSGANAAGAEGPMQFEPATFAAHAVVGPGGANPPSPYDPVDAVYTAAALLCADGGGSATGRYGAIWDYDHTAGYVATVLVLATALTVDPSLGAAPATALAFATGQLGVPYRWGGESPGVAFDCSGLVQLAERAAGVVVPRVAQDQYDAGPAVPPTTPTEPGDLVFFGASRRDVSHVGLYVGDGDMIDAPHTGAVVRIEPTPTVPGQAWGTERYVGATRPG